MIRTTLRGMTENGRSGVLNDHRMIQASGAEAGEVQREDYPPYGQLTKTVRVCAPTRRLRTSGFECPHMGLMATHSWG